MDASKLREKVYIGYGKAAKRIGYNAQQFRATSAFNPLATAALQTLPASFTTNFSYSAPNKYGQPTWLGVFDGREFVPGDYLISPEDGTFFVAAMQTTLPILLVSCNRKISILRPSMGTGPGAIGYGGDTAASEVPIMTNWPCSMLQGSKGEKNEVGLPADAKNPWFNVLLPYVDGVTLRTADIITDDLGGRYKLTSAELTDLGWRLTAQQVRP